MAGLRHFVLCAAALALSSTSFAQAVPVIPVTVGARAAADDVVARVAVAVGHDARAGADLAGDLGARLGARPSPADTLRAERDAVRAACDAYISRGPRMRSHVEPAVRALGASPERLEGLADNRAAYLRGLFMLAQIDLDSRARNNDPWLRRAIEFDAAASPSDAEFSPALRSRLEHVREELRPALATLTVVVPDAACHVRVGGVDVSGGRERSHSVHAGVREVSVECGGRSSERAVRVRAGATTRVTVDPALDAALTLDHEPRLSYATEAAAARLRDDAVSLGEALEARRVLVIDAERVHVFDVSAHGERTSVAVTASDLAAQIDAALSDAPPAAVATAGAPRVEMFVLQRETPRGAGVGPWVLVGVGGAALAASAAFFALRGAAFDDAISGCPVDSSGAYQCGSLSDAALATANSRYDDAGLYQTLAFVSVGVGAAAVVGGLAWYFAAPRSAARTSRAPSLSGNVASTGGSVSLTWSF